MIGALLFGLPIVALLLLRRSPQYGILFIVFLLICLPLGIRVSAGGAFILSVHRSLMLVFLAWALFSRRQVIGSVPYGLKRFLWALVLANTVSSILAVYFITALKNNLSFILEEVAFCVLLNRYITGTAMARRLLLTVSLAIGVVGMIGWFNRYLGYNPIETFFPGITGVRRPETVALGGEYYGRRDVFATFPHRILFGYGMAMVLPLAMAQALGSYGLRRIAMMVGIGVVGGACYFSNSRGPWIGAVLGVCVLWLLGSPKTKRLITILSVSMLIVLVIRPGVRETFWGLIQTTWQKDAAKHQSYEYRWELWRVAWMAVSSSPVRAIFGFGGSATDSLDFSEWSDLISVGALKSKSNEEVVFTSWDNTYARDLVAFGAIGLLIRLLFYGYVIVSMTKLFRKQSTELRDMTAALVAAVAVYCFGMSNISMFAPQLKFVLWAIIAVFVAFERETEREETCVERTAVLFNRGTGMMQPGSPVRGHGPDASSQRAGDDEA
jgi:hypothetical protein